MDAYYKCMLLALKNEIVDAISLLHCHFQIANMHFSIILERNVHFMNKIINVYILYINAVTEYAICILLFSYLLCNVQNQ